MTFSERARARLRASVTAFCAGLAVAEALVWVLMTFVVFVALNAAGVTIAPEMRRMILILNQVTVAATACCMWFARGIQLTSDVNNVIAGASDLQKRLLGTQLIEEAGTSAEKIERVLAAEGVQVVDITGGPAEARR